MHINEQNLERSVQRCSEKQILIPTFAQLRNPSLVPERVRNRLRNVGLWDLNPANLFRITWKNEPVESGGLFNEGNWIKFPSALTGYDCVTARSPNR